MLIDKSDAVMHNNAHDRSKGKHVWVSGELSWT